jgi:tRNA G10  N-methylase Trm11
MRAPFSTQLRPVHTFPARMAASIALEQLREKKRPARVLDPMAGSGTTIVIAKTEGHFAIGFDTDPLAVLIAKAWCMNSNTDAVRQAAKVAQLEAANIAQHLCAQDAFPCDRDDKETRHFIRYWFDLTNRRQLTSLARAINNQQNEAIKTLLWCAFSRLIIAKEVGASLAMDLSHSRPHRVRNRAPIKAFDHFLSAVETCLGSLPGKGRLSGRASVNLGDARSLPLSSGSIDLVITSPPYLNAIDYMRCHKFSLIWMGYSIAQLRKIRSSNIGTEVSLMNRDSAQLDSVVKRMIRGGSLSSRTQGILRRYVSDMEATVAEIARVLKPHGTATFVVGNSNLGGTFVQNSKALSLLAVAEGLNLVSSRVRVIPNNRRYLPPPSSGQGSIHKRMREEVVLTFQKSKAN